MIRCSPPPQRLSRSATGLDRPRQGSPRFHAPTKRSYVVGLQSTSSRPASARLCASGNDVVLTAWSRASCRLVSAPTKADPCGVPIESLIANRLSASKTRAVTSARLPNSTSSWSAACFVLQAAHNRVVQVPLGRKVPVHGPLADLGSLGDGPERQVVPVPGGESVDQLGVDFGVDVDGWRRRPFVAPGCGSCALTTRS